MNPIRQGFYTDLPDLNGLQEIDSIADLVNFQIVLHRLHFRRHSAWCGCGSKDSRRELTVFQLPKKGILSLRCANRAEHPLGECIFARSETADSESPIFSDSMFRPVERIFPSKMPEHASAQINRADFVSFGRFATGVASEAFIESIVFSNILGAATSKIWVFAYAVERAVARSRFTGGANAMEAAARHGARIAFGTLDSYIEFDVTGYFPLTLRCWSNGILVTETFLISGAVWRDAIGEALVWGSLMRPPYLCFAVVSTRGEVVKMRVFALFTDGRVLAPAESEYERAYAHFLTSSNLLFLKPLLRSDVAKFLGRMGLSCPAAFPFRPDYVVIRQTSARSDIEIVEVRGMPVGKHREYDERLAIKHAYVEQLGAPFSYHEPRGWEHAPVKGCIEWSDTRTGWMPPSPSVVDWLRQGNA